MYLWRQHRTLFGNATKADDKSKEDTNAILLLIMARMECFPQSLLWPWNTIALKTETGRTRPCDNQISHRVCGVFGNGKQRQVTDIDKRHDKGHMLNDRRRSCILIFLLTVDCNVQCRYEKGCRMKASCLRDTTEWWSGYSSKPCIWV